MGLNLLAMTSRKNKLSKGSNSNRKRNAPKRGTLQTANRKAGGGARAPRRRLIGPVEAARKVFNAFHPSHLPLSVPLAPHMIVTTRKTVTTTDKLMVIGSMDEVALPGNGSREWINSIMLGFSDEAVAVAGATVTRYGVPAPTTDRDDFEVVPAAISFQVQSPASLASASGIAYVGRCKNVLNAPKSGDPTTVANFADNLVAFCNPKAVSGAKLAMTPQQVNLLPGNHTEITNFRSMEVLGAQESVQWLDTTGGPAGAMEFAGFKPGFIYNPNGEQLNVTVAVQWRLRLSPMNPLHSSMSHYAPTPSKAWHAITNAAESLGHGVEDVAGVGAVGAAGYLATGGAAEGGLLAGMGEAFSAALPALETVAPLLLL